MPTIQALREMYPDAKDASDEQILSWVSERAGTPLADTASMLGYSAPKSDFGKELSAGLASYKAGMQHIGAALGSDTAAEWAAQNELKAKTLQGLSNAPHSYEDVKFGDKDKGVLNYLGSLAAGSAPFIAEQAAFTAGDFLTGGALTPVHAARLGEKAVELGMFGKSIARNVASGATESEAKQAAVNAVARTATGAEVSYPSSVGQLLQNQNEQAGQYNLPAALAGAVPYSLLNEVGIEGAVARRGLNVANLENRALRSVGTGIITGAQEAGGEVGQAFLENAAKKSVDNSYDLLGDDAMRNLRESAVGGFALGHVAGMAGGALSKPPVGQNSTESLNSTKPDDSAINKAIDGNATEVPAMSPELDALRQRSAEIQQQQAEQDAQLADAQRQAKSEQVAQQEAEAKQRFIDTATTYGVKPQADAVGQFNVAGKRLFSQAQADQFLQGIDQLNADKTPEQKGLIGAAIGSGNLKVAQTANPKAVNTAAIKFLDSWGFADAESKIEAANRANTLINSLEGPKALKEAEQLNGFVKAITGADAPAFVSLQQAAQPLTKGASNERLQLQQQGNAGLRTVSEQGGTTQTGGTESGNVRPTSVQPIGAGSVGTGSPSVQIGSVPRVGISASTGTNVSGSAVPVSNAQAQKVTSDRQEALTIVNQVIVKAFGSRNADIILAVLTQEKTQAEIAKEFGISDARVNQIAGPQAQETWGPRILLAARNMGISKDEMGNLLETMSREETTAEEQVVNEQLLTEAPSEATSAQNVDDTNIATSDENLTLGAEELSKEEGPSGFRVFNPDVSGGTELEDAAAKNRTRRKLKTTELESLKDFELNNLAADENTTVEELDQIVAELLRRQEVRVNKGTPNAVQKQSPSKGNVRKPAGNRQEVGEANAKPEKPARARQEGETDEEAGAKAWNEGVKDFPDAPKFEELSKDQQEDWISFGEENWTPADVQTELIKLAKESATGKAQFSRKESSGETWDADGLTSLLKQLFVAKKNFDNLISVVANYDELPAYVKNAVKKSGAIQAFVYGKRVYLLADQIEIGQELPVFLHEVGVHLGMENLLGTTNYRKLAGQVMTWAQEKGTSVEHEIAKAAKKRVDAAVAVAKENNETLTADEQLDEMLAYFVEEAVARGIDPTAAKIANTQIGQWFRSLMTALKVALRKIGFEKFDQLSAGNIVDLAFGAAKLEISGAYHGTSAEFRKFLTKHIGTGEGAVAYGWGLYMAERFGIALDYMRADVKRKSDYEGYSYKGQTGKDLRRAEMKNLGYSIENKVALDVMRRAKKEAEAFGVPIPADQLASVIDMEIADWQKRIDNKEVGTLSGTNQKFIDALKALDVKDFTEAGKKPGNLMRLLPMADEDSLMDLDETLGKQPEVLQKIKDGFPAEVLEAVDDKSNLSLEDMTGRDLQRVLVDLENQGVTDLFFQMPDSITDSIKQGRFMSEEIVSKYLEYKLGIEGVKYFDASSRNIGGQISAARLPELSKINFEFRGKKFTPTYASIRSNDVIVKGRVDDTSIQLKLSDFVSTEERMAIIDHIKDEQARQTKNVVMFKDKGVSRVATFPGAKLGGKVQYSLAKARETTAAQVARLPKPIRGPLQHLFDNVVDFAKKGLPWAAFTEDLADIASKYIPSAKKYVMLMKERQATRTRIERNVDQILQQYDKLPNEVKGTGEKSVNQFLMDSTMKGLWAYNPGWIKNFDETKDIDADMKERFDAMPQEAQNLIKAVFAHGQQSLLSMQKAVIENINTEYDALIAAAKKVNDTAEEADLIKKKANSLAEYRTLMRTGSKTPYAPLKRFGNYVVVGRSQAYLDAEKVRDDESSTPDEVSEANKKIRDLEKNEDHYFVQFAETMGEAKAIAREEQQNYALVEPFEKDTARAALYGGKDVQGLFHRLRNMVEESSDASTADKSERAINRLLSDLHLSLLSDQSARQAERKRRKIAGAEKDMMRAFATQGRANAHFIASLENSADIYDNLRQMKAETDARTPGREERRRYYNEFMKRHAMGLEYSPSPFVDKALSTTSAWMLLTNPSYYLQNMTQPFMMSLPVVGGKHGYAKSWAAFTKAYSDISTVIRKHGLDEASYSKLPEDVRAVVEQLVNRGRIDISLEQDLGRWRSTEDSKFAKFGQASEFLRSMAQNIETINRVATAVAAYRLEVKESNPTRAMNYADKIIYTTHGDYSGFNAPRVTRSTLGRLATQFRKFQLIQLSLIARLFNDSFAGADKDTRMIGRKALLFTLSHTAVMGGAMGLPGFYGIAALYGMLFGDEDEPDNPELALRRAIGNEALADLLVRGAPAMLGVDLSGKLGMGQMLSVLPYTDITLSRKGVYEVAGTLLTGPFGGLLAKSADGISYMGQGDYYKGVEQLLPTGLSNVLKGVRVSTEGVTSRSGDVTMSPDELSFVDGFMVALGLPTKTMTDRQFLQAAKYDYDQFYNDKASEVKRAYVRAYKEGDNSGLSDAREEWKNLQESRAKNGYTKQPLSTLIKAPMEQRKRERETVGGVAVNKANRGFVKKTSEL